MNVETIMKTGTVIRNAGASEFTKVRSAERFDNMIFSEKRGVALAATHRTMVGTLDELEMAIKESGFIVRGSKTANDSHIVFFDLPNELSAG